MDRELEIRRGEEAQRILESALYKEAFAAIEERLIAQLAQIEITKERAEYMRQLLVANRKIRGYLANVMTTGEMATLDETKSFASKVRSLIN